MRPVFYQISDIFGVWNVVLVENRLFLDKSNSSALDSSLKDSVLGLWLAGGPQ